MPSRPIRAVSAALLSSVLVVCSARGQDNPPASQPAIGGLNPDSFYGKEPTEGVYVRDSAGAVEKLVLASKMERLKNWKNSAELYQEVIVKYSDRVIPLQKDKNNRVYQYTSIINLVQEQLSHWPQEGLDVYRARYEAAAAADLQKARPDDAPALNRIYSTYFVTDSGMQAGIRLIDLYLEEGEFPAAGWIGDRLLTLHPHLESQRPGILYRAGLAHYFAGDLARAQSCLATLQQKFPNERGIVRGKDVVLADALAQDIQKPLATSTTTLSDSWLMVGGDSSRSRVSPASGKPGARLYGIVLPKPAVQTANTQNNREIVNTQWRSVTEQGLALGIMPAVDRGELYFQDGQHLYGVSLESGVPLPAWTQTYGDGVFTLNGVTAPPRTQENCVTLTDHEVLAVMGLPDYSSLWRGISPDTNQTRLVCLDRANGKEKWEIGVGQIPGIPEAERQSLHMAGSPLVVGDAVLVFASAGKQAGFEDAHVLCFDLSTGKPRWSTYVASASAANQMFGMQMPPLSDNTSHVAYANGRVYVQTNLGAVAALDAYTGSITWLDIYPTDRPTDNGGFRRGRFWNVQPPSSSQPLHKPWAYNPVMVSEGYVFSLPADSRNLLIYHAGSGEEFKRIDLADIASRWQQDHPNDEDPLDRLDTFIGVSGDQLLLSAEHAILCLNWKKYDRATMSFTALDSPVTWIWVIGKSKPAVRGRPFLTNDSLFFTTSDRLYRLLLKPGRLANDNGVYPREPAKWEEPEGPGNLVVTNDHVVIAGMDAVNVYTDLTVARANLEQEIASAPTDVAPRLKYAEVMLAAGEADVAIGKLDEAIKLLGGPQGMQPGPYRDRLFNDTLTFAQKLSAEELNTSREHAVQLFDRAALAAYSPMQQVHYRLARGRHEENSKKPQQAIELYQQILSDAQLRPVPMIDGGSGAPTQAGAIAEASIASLIRFKPALYQPVQQMADQAFKEAAESPDDSAGKLLAVAETYPNASSVAQQAMLAAADAYEKQNNPRLAIQALRQMWFKYPEGDQNQRARILESLARNYFAIPNHSEAAAAALARATTLQIEPRLQRPLQLPDGRTIPKDTAVALALEEVRKFRGQEAARALPDFHVPIQRRGARLRPFAPDGPNTVLDHVAALILPLQEAARSDRVVAWSTDAKLLVLQAGQMTPMMSSDAIKEEPRQSAWSGDTLLVWGQSHLASLDSTSGQVNWQLDIKSQPVLEVAKLGGDAEQMQPRINGEIMLLGNGGVFIRNNDRRARANLMRGVPMGGFNNNAPAVPVVAKPAANAPEQIVEVHVGTERVLLTTSTGRLLAIQIAGGKVAWQVRLSDRPIDRLVANEDFAVVKVSDDTAVRLAALDAATGQLRCSKSFGLQNGVVPINLALAVDGTLVYTLPDRLCLKDLYKPWPDPTDREASGPQGPPPYVGAYRPEQLMISEGRILALADSGSQKFVNVYSLETGQPVVLRYKSPDGDQEVDRRLEVGKSWNVLLRLVGPHLYAAAPGEIYAYNLDRPEETWAKVADPGSDMLPLIDVRQIAVGRRYMVILEDEPQNAPDAPVDPQPQVNAAPSPAYRLNFFRRAPISDTDPAESGVWDYPERVADAAGILDTWQPVEGGFYYITADKKLHLLKGAEDQPAN